MIRESEAEGVFDLAVRLWLCGLSQLRYVSQPHCGMEVYSRSDGVVVRDSWFGSGRNFRFGSQALALWFESAAVFVSQPHLDMGV